MRRSHSGGLALAEGLARPALVAREVCWPCRGRSTRQVPQGLRLRPGWGGVLGSAFLLRASVPRSSSPFLLPCPQAVRLGWHLSFFVPMAAHRGRQGSHPLDPFLSALFVLMSSAAGEAALSIKVSSGTPWGPQALTCTKSRLSVSYSQA